MKAIVSVLSVAVILAMTMPLKSANTLTGRIVHAGWEWYFITEDHQYYRVINEGAHPEMANTGNHTVKVTGTYTKDTIDISHIEPVEPDALLKRLFPTAVAFQRKNVDWPLYNAYAADPRTNPSAPLLGFAFWTTDVVPEERGFKGPIMMLVGMSGAGILSGVIVDYDPDPYGPTSAETPEFIGQFKGKSIRAPFRIGEDVMAVSKASVSSSSAIRAIRDSSRAVARRLLTPDMVK